MPRGCGWVPIVLRRPPPHVIAGLGSMSLVHRCRHILMNPEDPAAWQPPAIPSPDAGAWPPKVAQRLVQLVVGLTWEPQAHHRLPLAQAHTKLEALAATVGVDDVSNGDF